MTTEQIAVRVPEQLLSDLDDLVGRGVYESRAAAVRAGIEAVMELDRRHLTDLAIVEGYRRLDPVPRAIVRLSPVFVESNWSVAG